MTLKKTAKPKKTVKKKTAKRATPRRAPTGRIGARPLLSKQLIKKLAKVIKAGNYTDTACKTCGVAKSTYYNWLARGEAELDRLIALDEARELLPKDERGPIEKPLEIEKIYLELLDTISKAEAEGEFHAVKCVRSGFKDPKVALEFLSRRYGNKWARNEKHELTGKDGESLHMGVIILPDNGRGEIPDETSEGS